MESTLELGTEKKYSVPVVEILLFDNKDIVCLSEGNDNDFDAGDLGGFVD